MPRVEGFYFEVEWTILFAIATCKVRTSLFSVPLVVYVFTFLPLYELTALSKPDHIILALHQCCGH